MIRIGGQSSHYGTALHFPSDLGPVAIRQDCYLLQIVGDLDRSTHPSLSLLALVSLLGPLHWLLISSSLSPLITIPFRGVQCIRFPS